MLLAIDIGNTNVVAGIFDGSTLLAHWRLATDPKTTADEYGVLCLSLMARDGRAPEQITGDKVEGKVTYIAATADDATRSFPVEIELPNADGKIRDGITADAVVNVGTAPVTVLPQSVLTLDDTGVLGIRTVEEGSKVAFHAINIIKDTRDGVWVLGLPPKINVITVGQEYVQPGQVVDAKTDSTPIGATADGSDANASSSSEQPS